MMFYKFGNSKKSKKAKIEKLEEELDKLQQVIESLLDELGYKVTASIYDSEWEAYEVIKVDKKKDE